MSSRLSPVSTTKKSSAQGMRIENDYVITESGVENLCPFPMEL